MPGSSKKALTLCLFQSLAGVIFGWGNSEGAGLFSMDSFTQRFGQCDEAGVCSMSIIRQSAFTGLLSLGALVGAVSSGSIADRIGLRLTCIIFICIHLIGSAIECSGKVYQQIYVARVLLGLGIGATSGLVPVFQAEAAPPKWRGLVTGSFQLCVTMGIWGVSITSWAMNSGYVGDKTWHVPTGLPMAFDVCLLVGFILCPESPRFLAKQGKWDECRKNLANLRSLPVDSTELDEEMAEVEAKAAEDKERGAVSYAECFSTKDRILYRVMIGCMVQIGQQITGINFFFSYGVQFAQTAGLDDSYIFQIILASVNVAMSFPGIWLVDRAGRRPVLLYGYIAMFIGQIVTGSVSKAHPESKQAGDVLITFTCFFIAAFACTAGPVAWVVCGETFPIRLSARCVTIGTGANWLMSLVIAFAAPQIQARIGTGITFVWAGCLALNFVFTWLVIPETKGLSIEQIDAMYLSRVPAFKTNKLDKVAAQMEPTAENETKAHQEHAAESNSPLDSSSINTAVGEAAEKEKKRGADRV